MLCGSSLLCVYRRRRYPSSGFVYLIPSPSSPSHPPARFARAAAGVQQKKGEKRPVRKGLTSISWALFLARTSSQTTTSHSHPHSHPHPHPFLHDLCLFETTSFTAASQPQPTLLIKYLNQRVACDTRIHSLPVPNLLTLLHCSASLISPHHHYREL